MNHRPIIQGDKVNYFTIVDKKRVLCYGVVVGSSWSPIVEVREIWQGNTKTVRLINVSIDMLTVCK